MLLTTLSACASFGPLPAVDAAAELPAPPADLAVCFGREVAAPPKGKITRAQAFELIERLKASEAAKSACGKRLLCWYADIARGYGPGKDKGGKAPECALKET